MSFEPLLPLALGRLPLGFPAGVDLFQLPGEASLGGLVARCRFRESLFQLAELAPELFFPPQTVLPLNVQAIALGAKQFQVLAQLVSLGGLGQVSVGAESIHLLPPSLG